MNKTIFFSIFIVHNFYINVITSRNLYRHGLRFPKDEL